MIQHRPVSIADIAKVAGVSHPTVSRALKDSPLISHDVRERIQQLAGEMGYTPNALAQSLQMRRSYTIGLVVTSIADPFFTDVVMGVEEVANPAHYGVFLSASYNNPERELAVIETFHRRRVDGILIASSRLSAGYAQQVGRINVPTILVNNETQKESDLLNWVAVDDFMGGQLAAAHLLGLGHRRIAYLGIDDRPRSNQQRLAGYRAAIAAGGGSNDTELVAIYHSSENSACLDQHETEQQNCDVLAGLTLLPRLLEAGATAICCYNDMVAVGVLLACRELGIGVPQDLSIVGYDDIELTRYISPPLTTVHQPAEELGRRAMRLLLDLLDAQPIENHRLTPTLLVRGSTAPPA